MLVSVVAMASSPNSGSRWQAMGEERFLIQVQDGLAVSAVRTLPESTAAKGVFLYAPGAGSNINDPFGGYLSHRLAESGFATLRFQFP